MPGKLNTNQIEEIAEDEIAQALKTLKKLQFKKGARFSVDSKGNTTKNYKDGGLAMAIDKVKAKEMKLGGDVPMPKPRPKSLKADKTEILNEDFSKNVAKTNQKNKNLKGNQKKLDKNKDGTISGADFKMMKYGGKVQKMKYGGVAKGGKMGCRGMGAAIKGGGYTIS